MTKKWEICISYGCLYYGAGSSRYRTGSRKGGKERNNQEEYITERKRNTQNRNTEDINNGIIDWKKEEEHKEIKIEQK